MRIFRMAFVVGGFAGALMAGNVGTLNAAPLPTNVASMKSMVADSSIQVRWGGWRGGGLGYRGFGGWGYRGWGWGAGALAGAVIGGAIASSAYGYYGGPAYSYGGPPYRGFLPLRLHSAIRDSWFARNPKPRGPSPPYPTAY